MQSLNEQQSKRAIAEMNRYLAAPRGPEGKTPVEASEKLDADRVTLIESDLKPLLNRYLAGKLDLGKFKSQVDGINKRNELWGFRGIKGQMFFNMLLKVTDDPARCDKELKAALTIPTDEKEAARKISALLEYIKDLGESWVKAGNTRYGVPKSGSIPYFVSYFWQIQDRDVWPVYYTNAFKSMTDLNIWKPIGDYADYYIQFKQLHEFLIKLFSQSSNRPFDLYDVEHVFWYMGGNPYNRVKSEVKASTPSLSPPTVRTIPVSEITGLPESYVPPIVSVLPALARHEAPMVDAAKRSGLSIERAFEKSVNAAFTILGYKTELLGQGQGRVPDGRAFAVDDNYAILWDSKVREAGYALGTDDRAIREYINTQSRELRRSYKKIYYVIISSSFADEFEDMIASIKMETDISEVILLEAEALVTIVEAKLRDPLNFTLGLDGIQRFLTDSGSLTSEIVREYLG